MSALSRRILNTAAIFRSLVQSYKEIPAVIFDWEALDARCRLSLYCRCGLSHSLEDEDVIQLVKTKTANTEGGRGRFKSKSDKPDRIADREKKAALKTWFLQKSSSYCGSQRIFAFHTVLSKDNNTYCLFNRWGSDIRLSCQFLSIFTFLLALLLASINGTSQQVVCFHWLRSCGFMMRIDWTDSWYP